MLSIAPSALTLLVGNVVTLKATVPRCKWQSSDPTIATVSGSGVVTALAVGSVSIRAHKGPEKAFALVVVQAAPVPEPVPPPAPTPTPDPVPAPSPSPSTPQVGPRSLVGGWRLAQDFPGGAIAIDFATMRCWMVGHRQRNELVEYQLPAMGSGREVSAYPRVDPIRTIPTFWGTNEYANNLVFWRGKLWASPRNGYDGAPPNTLTLFAEDGETITLPIPRQVFTGFVKRGSGLDPYIGCGGRESGQGSVCGPTLATLAGEIKIQHFFPELPGPNLEYWNLRAQREPNYWPVNHVDSWVAWEPRVVNGVREGRWADDRIWAGGLVLPEGIYYWPQMGTGDIDYARQNDTMGAEELNITYAYRYDPVTFQLIDYARTPFNIILGHELGPDGAVYLSEAKQWTSQLYQVDVAVKCYR